MFGTSWFSTLAPKRMRGIRTAGPNVGVFVLSARAPDGTVDAVVDMAGEERVIPATGGWAFAVEWNVPEDARYRVRLLRWAPRSD